MLLHYLVKFKNPKTLLILRHSVIYAFVTLSPLSTYGLVAFILKSAEWLKKEKQS